MLFLGDFRKFLIYNKVMASKKTKSLSLNLSYDAPVTVGFSILSLVLFALNHFVFQKNGLSYILTSPSNSGGDFPFDISNPLSYLRIILHAFGSADNFAYVSNMIIILLLGPGIEEQYGSVVSGLMMGLSALLSGVLSACFCKVSVSSSSCIVFMFVLLNSYLSITKKKIPLASVLVLIFYIAGEILSKNPNGVVGIIVNVSGGLCGSLLAFLASPKQRSSRKSNNESKPLKNKNSENENSKKESESDETVIGTLKF